jgi:quercetin dioxygenase-like cupin family protein
MANTAHISQPAAGVQVIADILTQPGVHMAEGYLSPLIWGDSFQTYVVEMPPGTFLDEHPHSFEALLYAVNGRFVLSSDGQRHVLESGSLMSFGAHVATGYEVPFTAPATVLVFRGEAAGQAQDVFLSGLSPGQPPNLRDLPADHPARVFARGLSPPYP